MKLVDENVIIDRVAYSTSKSEISHEDLVVSVRYLLNRKNEYDSDSNQENNGTAGGSSSSSSNVDNWVDLTSDQTISGVKTFASGLLIGNVRLVEDNGNLKIEKGVYSTSFMSSYGKSSGGSGAGGIEWGGVTGTGNAITDVTFENGQISFTKGNIEGGGGISGTYEIWGQKLVDSGTFNNVSGDLTKVGSITADGNYFSSTSSSKDLSVGVKNNNGSVSLLTSVNRGLYSDGWIIGTDGTKSFLMKGYVGINTNEPAHWLDVNGSARVSGNLYISTNGTYTPKIWYDSTNNCLRTNVGFVSDSFISAYGYNSSASIISFDTGSSSTNPTLKANTSGELVLTGTTGSGKYSTLTLGVLDGNASLASAGRIIFNGGGAAPASSIYGNNSLLNIFGYGGINCVVYNGSSTPLTSCTIDSSGLNIGSGLKLKIGATTLSEAELKSLKALI